MSDDRFDILSTDDVDDLVDVAPVSLAVPVLVDALKTAIERNAELHARLARAETRLEDHVWLAERGETLGFAPRLGVSR